MVIKVYKQVDRSLLPYIELNDSTNTSSLSWRLCRFSVSP